MGSEQIDNDEALLLQQFKSSLEPLTLSEQLDEWCAYYMAIGVPYEEFWYGDYCKLKYYAEAHRLKKKAMNERLWLQGMYNYEAFGVVLANAFRGKGTKTQSYAKEPYEVVAKTDREKAIEAEAKQRQIIANLNSMAQAFKEREQSNG